MQTCRQNFPSVLSREEVAVRREGEEADDTDILEGRLSEREHVTLVTIQAAGTITVPSKHMKLIFLSITEVTQPDSGISVIPFDLLPRVV